jgi:SAM-dependent methyltransferase
LQRRYAALGCAATDHSAWTPEHVGREIDLRYFRADNAYIWQHWMTHFNLRYLLTAYYAKSTDRIGALASMAEDGMFGAAVFDFGDGTLLSRDTLDSCIEINALDEAFGIARTPGMSVLDIGAGYGRLAHRLANAVPALSHVLCADAVPESTFLADYYLKFRGVGQRNRSIPLDEVDAELGRNPVDIATNIHSFSECTLGAICWWLDLLAKHHVRYLFIAPNTDDTLLSTEHSGPRRDFELEIVARGWKLRDKRPKFRNRHMQQNGVYPVHYFIFERA